MCSVYNHRYILWTETLLEKHFVQGPQIQGRDVFLEDSKNLSSPAWLYIAYLRKKMLAEKKFGRVSTLNIYRQRQINLLEKFFN